MAMMIIVRMMMIMVLMMYYYDHVKDSYDENQDVDRDGDMAMMVIPIFLTYPAREL